MNQEDELATTLAELDPAVKGYVEAYPSMDPESVKTMLTFVRAVEVLTERGARDGRPLGLTQAQQTLARLLFFEPSNLLGQTQIAKAMGVSTTYVTRLIDALEEVGWVKRIPDVLDRRVTFAQLTSTGRQRFLELLPNMVQFMEESLKDFTNEEKRAFQYLTAKIIVGISKARAAHDNRKATVIGLNQQP